jgi:hypothetical protein
MASRPVSFRIPPDVEAQFEEVKRALGKKRDGEALVEMIRTYPVAWRPSMSAMFRERPRGLGKGPGDGSERVNDYVYGPVSPRVRREDARLRKEASRKSQRRASSSRRR